MARKKELVFAEIVREIYTKFFKKKLSAEAQIKHLKHITKSFPMESPSRIFAYAIRLQRSQRTNQR